MRASPMASPSSCRPYQAFTASEVDSWSWPSPSSERPAAQEWPRKKSMWRKRGKRGSDALGLAMSRTSASRAARWVAAKAGSDRARTAAA